MAYLIFTANGEEYDRRELRGPLTLGRAPECDLSIPDITLSRRHCRIEPTENGGGWQLVDLHSKNGTQFRGQNIERHVLRDDDELRIGRTRLTFKTGAFVTAAGASRPRAVIRAADPHEALAGTGTGMVLCEPGETEKHEGMPVPQPRPLDPESFAEDDVYGMINEIASSSWDSTYAQNSKPVRMQRAVPVPGVTKASTGGGSAAAAAGSAAEAGAAGRPRPRVSFELQAQHSESAVFSAPLPEPDHEPAPVKPAPLVARRAARTRRRPALLVATAAVVIAAASLAAWIAFAAPRRARHGGNIVVPSAAPTGEEAARQTSRGDVAIAAVVAQSQEPPTTGKPAEGSAAADRSQADATANNPAAGATTRPAARSRPFEPLDIVPEDLFTAPRSPQRPFDLGEVPGG